MGRGNESLSTAVLLSRWTMTNAAWLIFSKRPQQYPAATGTQGQRPKSRSSSACGHARSTVLGGVFKGSWCRMM